MEPARSIGRLGFKKWYERRLIEAHSWLLTALLCAIFVEASLEEIGSRGHGLAWLGTAGGIFVGGLIVWYGLRRYIGLLVEAEHFATQSTCEACKAYARFDVVGEHPKITVRCRKCSHEWRMA
jgi:hypothetical protein